MDIFTLKKDNLSEICKKDNIAFMGIFGSYARGEAKKGSDIDILVRFSKKKSLLDIVRIEKGLSMIFDRRVDLLTEASISPYIKDKVKDELEVIYECVE